MPGLGRVDISPAIKLPVNVTPPLDCSSETRGTVALDSKVELCVCDGVAWKLVKNGSACAWAPAK